MSDSDSPPATKRNLLGWVRACLTTLQQLQDFCERHYPDFLDGLARPLRLEHVQTRLAETYTDTLLSRLWTEFPSVFPPDFYCPPVVRSNDNDGQGDLALGMAMCDALNSVTVPPAVSEHLHTMAEQWRRERDEQGPDPTGVRRSGRSHLRLLVTSVPGADEAANGGSTDPGASE
jgi:hypothetical protein